MLWVLQSNLSQEPGYGRLVEAVRRLQRAHVFVKPVPFSDRLIPGDFDAPTAVDLDEVPEPSFDTCQPIVVMGSYTLAKVARARGWKPGAFVENTRFDDWRAGWGPDRLLNATARVVLLRDVHLDRPTFVRPALDSKSFVGKVYEPEEFNAWRVRACELGVTVDGSTEVVVAPPREIYAEVRCFVVDGQVVTASLYRVGSQVCHEEVRSDDDAVRFAEELARTWVPSRAFVVDVALTSGGHRVVEVNCINAAGFYACDLQRLVHAFDEAFS